MVTQWPSDSGLMLETLLKELDTDVCPTYLFQQTGIRFPTVPLHPFSISQPNMAMASYIAFKRLVSQKHPTLYEQAMQLLLTKFYDRNDSACPAHTHFVSFSYHGMPYI